MSAVVMQRERPESCLSDLALERLQLGELTAPAERAAVEHHLADCEVCRRRLAALDAEPAQLPDELWWRAHRAPRPPRRSARAWRMTGGLGAAAALAAGLLLFARPRPSEQTAPAAGTRAKGDGLTLELFARRADGRLLPVFDGTALASGDAVRFSISARAAGQLAVVGLDGAGQVSVYAPAAPDVALAVAAGSTTLPGSVVLDDAPGEERFVALLCATPPSRAALLAAGAQALAAGGGQPGRAPRLDLPCRQDALTIRKAAAK